MEEYTDSIRKKKERLQKMKDEFLMAAKSEPDEFRRVASKTFARYAEIMEDLFTNIEMLAITNAGLKSQNEILKDIVIQLQEVKNNRMMQSDIERAFSEYNERSKKWHADFKNQSEKVECPVCKERVELTKVEEHEDHIKRFYSCGHTSRLFQRSIVEPPVVIKDEVKWVKISDRIGGITRAKESKNYYDALSLACSAFEDYGKEILSWDSQTTGKPISGKILKRLESILGELYNRNLIDKTTYDKMNEVRQLRNDFQHRGLAFKLSSSQAQDAEEKITKAIDCVNVLKTNYEDKIK